MRLYDGWVRSVVGIKIIGPGGVAGVRGVILTVASLGFLIVLVVEGGCAAKVGAVEGHGYGSGFVCWGDRVGENG